MSKTKEIRELLNEAREKYAHSQTLIQNEDLEYLLTRCEQLEMDVTSLQFDLANRTDDFHREANASERRGKMLDQQLDRVKKLTDAFLDAAEKRGLKRAAEKVRKWSIEDWEDDYREDMAQAIEKEALDE